MARGATTASGRSGRRGPRGAGAGTLAGQVGRRVVLVFVPVLFVVAVGLFDVPGLHCFRQFGQFLNVGLKFFQNVDILCDWNTVFDKFGNQGRLLNDLMTGSGFLIGNQVVFFAGFFDYWNILEN